MHLNEYRPCESWRKALLFFSQTIPPVRHAAIALAMIQRHFVDQDSKRGNAMLCVEDHSTDQTPLLHYNRAIRLLLHPSIGKGSHGIAVTLLVCYLFVCFEQLMGNNVQALKHLNGGLELSRNINNPTFGESAAQNARSSEADAIICHVEKQIRRLDLQAGMVLVDWVPTNMHQPFIPEPGLFDATCWSLNHAADHLQNILAQLMMLRNAGRRGSQARGILPAHHLLKNTKDSVVDQLEKWSILFDDFLQRAATPKPSIETDLVVPLLCLQQIVAWILVQSDGVNAEMKYDEFLPQFRQSITQARQVAMAHRRYAGTLRSTFTPEIGFVPILYIIGAKCRHPALRREASSILRQQLVRESVWHSIATARILDRVIEIEEATIRQDQKAQFMGIIPIWQRIDELSFTHIPVEHSSAGVRITYTFCFRTEIHVESLG